MTVPAQSRTFKSDHETQLRVLDDERWAVLEQLEVWLETPMLVLGFVWLALFVIELTGSLSPVLEFIGGAIWVVFILDFALKFALAPDKTNYLKANWLTALALVVPALRVFRIFRVLSIFRAARAARGLKLFRVLSSVNRGMRALGRTMRRRGVGYVIVLSAVVILLGAAGMYAFENDRPDGAGLKSYGDALWWTAMLLTSLGSEYWPQSAEGRVLCFLLALYGFAVFGYVTATIATFFVGRDAESDDAELAGAKSIDGLRVEIAALREEVRSLSRTTKKDSGHEHQERELV
jgi:voltage-gated potassium channel